MARSKYDWSEKRIEKFIKEKRGQLRGDNYIPWIKVQDISSRGVSTQVAKKVAWTHQRDYHLFSQNEFKFFQFLEWLAHVVEIREQFPLLDREIVKGIAKDLGIKSPRYPRTKVTQVLTTDFIITVRLENGKTVDIARTIKPSTELKKKSTLEKFQIEQIYLREVHGITDWGIITPAQYPKHIIKFVKRIYFYKHRSQIKIDDGLFEEIAHDLTKRVLNNDRAFRRTIADADQDYRYRCEKGTCQRVALYLLANRKWIIDLNRGLNFNRPLQLLNGSRSFTDW